MYSLSKSRNNFLLHVSVDHRTGSTFYPNIAIQISKLVDIMLKKTPSRIEKRILGTYRACFKINEKNSVLSKIAWPFSKCYTSYCVLFACYIQNSVLKKMPNISHKLRISTSKILSTSYTCIPLVYTL